VTDINTQAVPVSSEPQEEVTIGTTTFFVVRTVTTGLELWKTDGTTAGTVLVKDVNPGTGSRYGRAAGW
jgi:ELWxxDGT repeat protein